jgi:hypothetical protein
MIWALRNETMLVTNLDTDEWSFSGSVCLSVSRESYCTAQYVAGWVTPQQQQQAHSLFTYQPLTGH